jgi:tyrosinase
VRDVEDLGYTYDARPAPAPGGPERLESMAMSGSNPGSERELVGASEQAVQLVGAPAKVRVAIDTRARERFLESLPSAEARPRRVFLHVEDIEAERNPGTVYGVYVNLPDDAPAEQAPAHHAGNVSFFGIERTRDPRGDEPGHGLRATMDITALANDLAARNAWDDDQLDVTFRPLGLIPPEQPGPELEAALRPEARREDPPVRIGRVSVFYG